MKRVKQAVYVALGLALGLVALAHSAGAQTNDASPTVVESDIHRFVVEHDGTVREVDETTLRANTASGVDEIAQRYVWFNKDIETIDALAAESIDPEGRTYPVSAAAIRDVEEPRAAGAPMFVNGVLRTVIFPGVEPGWRVRLTFRKTRRAPGNRDFFSYFVVPTREPVEVQRLVFDLPADLALYADARGYAAQDPVTVGKRTIYEFDYRHGPYAPQEHGAVGYVEYGDRLMVTTVPSYAAFAARYRDAARDETAGDASVRALAQALTVDAPDTWSAAQRLYDWVRANVRYVALFVGETAAQPHRVLDILHNRYGDCKDQVALYVALLNAVGIRAEPALIGLGNVHTLPAVPGYGDGAINHVIVWIPGLNTFADTTAGGTAFGYLPLVLADRPALLVDTGTLVRTPPTQRRTRSARVQIEPGPDGTAAYAYRAVDGGATAELERNMFRRATQARIGQIGEARLRATGLRGTATVEPGDVRTSAGPFFVSMTGVLEHFVWPDGMTAIPALSSFSGGIASQVQDWLAVPARTQPFVCVDGTFDETGLITLPASARFAYVPPDLDVHSRFFEYRARYVVDPAAHAVQITRHLSAAFGKTVCTPDDFADMRATLLKIERDALAQIVADVPRAAPPSPVMR
jgi:transglutaminase-like putative cysteine protease